MHFKINPRYDREGKEGVDKQKTVQMDPRTAEILPRACGTQDVTSSPCWWNALRLRVVGATLWPYSGSSLHGGGIHLIGVLLLGYCSTRGHVSLRDT